MASPAPFYAWVTRTADGSISLVGVMVPGVGHTPLISHDRRMMEADFTVAMAQNHANALSQPCWLRRFHPEEQALQTILPEAIRAARG